MKKFSDNEYRDRLYDTLQVGLKLTKMPNDSNNFVSKEFFGYKHVYNATSYFDSSCEDYINADNMFIQFYVSTESQNMYKFKVDIYADSFSIMPGDVRYQDSSDEFYIYAPTLEQFRPFTEESFFQMKLLYDTQDLTDDELLTILEISESIRNKNGKKN